MKKLDFNDNKNIIAKNFKIARVKNGISQQQLAAKMQVLGVNIDQQMISKIENNTRLVTDYELACFCRALSVSPESLIGEFLK